MKSEIAKKLESAGWLKDKEGLSVIYFAEEPRDLKQYDSFEKIVGVFKRMRILRNEYENETGVHQHLDSDSLIIVKNKDALRILTEIKTTVFEGRLAIESHDEFDFNALY